MIEIHPATFQAMESAVEREQLERFVTWWHANGLPPAASDYLARLRRYAAEQAAEIGIEDDEQDRITLYAAAFGLLGEMDGIQFLQVSDILFLDEPTARRLARIKGVAQAAPVG